jgi:hypothetical protein
VLGISVLLTLILCRCVAHEDISLNLLNDVKLICIAADNHYYKGCFFFLLNLYSKCIILLSVMRADGLNFRPIET